MHLSIHHSLNIISTIQLMMCMRMCMLSMAMVSMWMIAICHSDLFVFLNVSSACNPLTCSARGCCSVGSCISVPVLRASVVIDVHGYCSLIWKIKLRLTWSVVKRLCAVVGTWTSVVRIGWASPAVASMVSHFDFTLNSIIQKINN